jgi:pyruvate dehydrogenase E2 component (dihydrolipoamide acetyltransferase)
MAEFVMPSLGADMERGTIIKWSVKQGDTVHRGDIVVEIETEKADMEVEIFQDGVVEEILVPEGEVAPVGAPLARIRAEAEAPAVEAQPAEAAAPAPVTVEARPAVEIRATSTARVLAEQLGVDLAAVRGTGVGGTITRNDVARLGTAAAPAKAPAPAVAAAVRGAVQASPRARRLAADLSVTAAVEDRASWTITGEDVERLPRRHRPHHSHAPDRSASGRRSSC